MRPILNLVCENKLRNFEVLPDKIVYNFRSKSRFLTGKFNFWYFFRLKIPKNRQKNEISKFLNNNNYKNKIWKKFRKILKLFLDENWTFRKVWLLFLPVEWSKSCLVTNINTNGMYFSKVENTPTISGLLRINLEK